MEKHHELTNMNGGAFDLLRLKHAGQMMPFWLCMSDAAKADAIYHFADYCRGMSSKMQRMSNQDIIELINESPTCPAIQRWQENELLAQKNREAGDLDYFIQC